MNGVHGETRTGHRLTLVPSIAAAELSLGTEFLTEVVDSNKNNRSVKKRTNSYRIKVDVSQNQLIGMKMK